MGSLRSALDDLPTQDLHSLSDDELTEHVVEIERATRVLEAERARAIAEVDERRAYAVDGFVSATAWLSHLTRIPGSAAAQQVRLARSLGRLPAIRAALEDGSLSVAAAGLLAAARDTDPDGFDDCERALVDVARALPIRDLRRAIEHWMQLADANAANDVARRRFERRGLFVSHTMDGMVRLDGDLDPETGQEVITALRAVVDGGARGTDEDARRPAQRRADALGEICRRYLDSVDRPVVAGERPHLAVTIDLVALGSRSGAARLDEAGIITAEAARRIACDAAVSRVVTLGRSQPLDVGRQTPVVPAALRRAVIVRDGGCRFPGCDRPHSWCDAHHVVHWADGGETSLANLVLLCRRHHRLVHERFAVRMADGRPIFTREDGTILEDRSPP